MKSGYLVRLFTLLLLVGLSLPTMASVRIWPGSAPCNGTLQACINAATSGDTVLIATNAAINENLTINKSLVVKAQTGYEPVFTAGSWIIGSSAIPGWSVEIGGLEMPNGYISLGRPESATDAAFFNIHDIRIINAASIGINLYGKPFDFSVANNRVSGIQSSGGGLIKVATGGISHGTLAFNRVESPSPGNGSGILVEAYDGADVTVNMYPLPATRLTV